MKDENFSEVIQFEGDANQLVWKSPIEDFNTTTQLIVHESQEAILFRNGQALDLFGPGRHTLETENIPKLKSFINIPTGGKTPFHCEVYFINQAVSLNAKWGTSSQFEVLDPKFEIPLNVGASGAMELKIKDSRKFLVKVVGTQRGITTERLVDFFKEKMTTKVKSYLAKIMSEVSYVVVNQYLEDISNALHQKLTDDMDFYGIDLINFYLSTIFIPENDKRKVKEVLDKKLEYGTLNYNWQEEQMAEISKKYAANPGNANNPGSMMAQLPVAFTFGQMLSNMATPMMGTSFDQITAKLSQTPNPFNTSNSSTGTMPNTQNQVPGSAQASQETIQNTQNQSSAMPQNEQNMQKPLPEMTPNIEKEEKEQEIPEEHNEKISEPEEKESVSDIEHTETKTETENLPQEEVICKNCGTHLTNQAKFCFNCGTKVEKNEKVFCKNCGKELAPTEKFCSECGTKRGESHEE